MTGHETLVRSAGAARSSSKRARRAGVAIVIALVALALSGVLLVSAVRIAAGEYRELRGHERHTQSEWLATSGIERARARLAVDPSYQGETWELSATDLMTSRDARVAIEVAAVPDRATARRVTARADYPADSIDQSRTTKQLTLDLPQTGATP